MPHHLKAEEWCQYREGVVVAEHAAAGGYAKKAKLDAKTSSTTPSGCLVDCGFPSKIRLANPIPADTRVTLKFSSTTPPASFPSLPELYGDPVALNAEATSPAAPREEAGYYWGYTTRRCASLSDVFTECPFDGGYDVSIGTSERGVPLSTLLSTGDNTNDKAATLPKTYNHLLLTFGGVAGIEAAITADREFAKRGVTAARAEEVFDQWVNLVPGQGSRTIRTEEAVWLGLMGLREYVERREG
jgi:predicted SPOUT superfamily RNA methylase MTH1